MQWNYNRAEINLVQVFTLIKHYNMVQETSTYGHTAQTVIENLNMVGLKDHMTQFKDTYLSEDHSHMSVNDMWVSFKTGFVEAVERFIPSKMTKIKYSVPWIDIRIKRLVKKRKKLYLRACKSKDPDVKIHFKRFRAHVQKVMRDVFWKYVSNIYMFENDCSGPDTPKPEKIKKIWSFIKSLKKDAFWITNSKDRCKGISRHL